MLVPVALVASLLLTAAPAPRADVRAMGESNAARAKRGLLPRKPPPKARAVPSKGRRLVRAPPPTFLGEPGDAANDEAPAPGIEPRLRLAARGVVTDVTISFRYD